MIMNYIWPDTKGKFGQFGGKFVPETLMSALEQLEATYYKAREDDQFNRELDDLQQSYNGRPTPLTFAANLTEHYGRAKIYLKREDLCHTGAHKLNNTLGQILLAKRIGKKRIIAETGAGQHGVATATVCAKFGLECVVYMGEVDVQRQALNVFRMKMLGAEVRPVASGTRTLKDATNEAIRDWVTNVSDTHYIIGSVVGPHPYPMIVRDFQTIIGQETRTQIMALENKIPDYILACVGGGSNAIGIFHPFIDEPSVKLIGVEAAGEGLHTGRHAASLCAGRPGVLHGCRTYLMDDAGGQIVHTHSVSAGLDYPGVGPEHAWLKDSGRAQYVGVTDTEALQAFHQLTRLEGILPALESSHAVAYGVRLAAEMRPDQTILINLSGRGDKDAPQVRDMLFAPKADPH